MTISNSENAFVWIWLPHQVEPVVAGNITKNGDRYYFAYGRSYFERSNAVPISRFELPLVRGTQEPVNGLWMAGCLRDGAPDAWGRRVILNRIFGRADVTLAQEVTLSEIDFMLKSGSDRIGALDFQLSPTHYEPRLSGNVELSDLIEAAERVERGLPLSPELDKALLHGTSLGGARPKVNIEYNGLKYIAKFSSTSDTSNVVKAEYVAMRLAKLVGINVADVELTKSMGKDVILIRRFDRSQTNQGECRHMMVSALSLLKLDEMMARYASYSDLAEIIRLNFDDHLADRKELFRRMVFNILIGNTDDHARNHAAFWTGQQLKLTPAYDICPQVRTGQEASQAMYISGTNSFSQVINCLNVASEFGFSRDEALDIYHHQRGLIESNWIDICNEASLNEIDMNLLWHRAILNPFALQGI